MKQFLRFWTVCLSAVLLLQCVPDFAVASESTEPAAEVQDAATDMDIVQDDAFAELPEEPDFVTLETESTVPDQLPEEVPSEEQPEEEPTEEQPEEEPAEEQPEEELPEELPEEAAQEDFLEQYAFFARSAEHAQEIADSMGAYLISYQHGIGTLCRTSTYALRRRAEPETVKLYPEYDYYIEETEEPGEPEEPEMPEETQPPEGPEVPEETQPPEVPQEPEDNSLDQWHLPILHAQEAWETASGQGILVAVIDTGIDMGHEDLVGAVAAAETTIPADYYGELSMFPIEYQGGGDNLGHGTHVAGIIGARKNTFGCTGIAPECSILSIKALERSGTQGRGKSSWVAAAVNLAVERGARVINLSLGGTIVKDELLMASIENALDAGVAVVCAAGNTTTPVLMYPAAYEGTIAVSAVKPQGDSVTFASSYSNSGDWIDLTAPGSNILSTVPGGYETKTGTSMACPMVSGALALLFSADPYLTTEQAADMLYRTATDLGEEGKDSRYGNGLPDLQTVTEAHQQQLQPDLPAASIPSGRVLYQNTPVEITTSTLHGTVIYTLDGSEPTEESAVWPREPMVFPEDAEQVTITARTFCADGTLGEPVSYAYRFVPQMTEINTDSATVADTIPGYNPILDPLLQRPCRRYRITVAPDYELEIIPAAEMTGVQLYLFDTEGRDASQLAYSVFGNPLVWKNDTQEEKTVFLSLVLAEPFEALQDTSYCFQFSRQEVEPPEDIVPAETEPEETEPKATEPKETEPKATEPKATEPKATEPKATEPPETQPPATEPPETAPTETVPAETVGAPMVENFEEDWLYAMQEPSETTAPTLVTEESTEEGGNSTMAEFDYRILLVGGIFALFGLGLILLGAITGRKAWLLIRSGQTATATVLKITQCSDDLAPKDLRATKHYTFRYQMTYQTKNGQTITAFWNEYPRIKFTKRYPEGSQLTIKYLPESPEMFMVKNHSSTMFSSIACCVVGTGVIAIGIWIMYLISSLA